MALCPDDELTALTQTLQDEQEDDAAAVKAALARYPEDARLHFMLGSIHAGSQEPAAAHQALSQAVALAPDFHIARYQLGFFELTSGEADAALSTWGPLQRLPEDHYLRHFVDGLTHLIRDEFSASIERLRSGIALNAENEPLNADIRLLIAETEKLNLPASGDPAEGAGDQSATSILLGQFGAGSTKH